MAVTSPTSLGITFPCLLPVVDPADFASQAATVEAALSATFALTVPLLNRDYVQAFAVLPTVAVNVTTTMSWSTPTAANNPSGLFNAGSPTLFTLQSNGSYLVTVQVFTGTATTITSMRSAILLSGVEQVWEKLPNDGTAFPPSFAYSGHLISATAGQTVTVTLLWTGTGGPVTPNVSIRIVKISDI